MEENGQKKDNKKLIIIIAVVIIIILIGVIVCLAVNMKGKNEEDTTGGMGYQVGVITDEESAKQAADELAKAAEGYFTFDMKLQALSKDGENFSCYIGNAPENSYDMYFELIDDADEKVIYKSDLIQIGYRVEEFKSSKKYKTGEYPVTVTYYQMEDDHKTLHTKVSSAITLIVE